MKDLDISVGDRVTYKIIRKNENESENEIVIVTNETMTKKIPNTIIFTKVERIGRNGWYTVYENQADILDEKEKEYLRNLIKPFKKDVDYIKKIIMPLTIVLGTRTKYCISVGMNSKIESFFLPAFSNNKMYKNMKIDKEYTLKELGLEN